MCPHVSVALAKKRRPWKKAGPSPPGSIVDVDHGTFGHGRRYLGRTLPSLRRVPLWCMPHYGKRVEFNSLWWAPGLHDGSLVRNSKRYQLTCPSRPLKQKRTPAQLGLGDKPVLLGEFRAISRYSKDAIYTYGETLQLLLENGWTGALGWDWKGSSSVERRKVKAFADANSCTTAY